MEQSYIKSIFGDHWDSFQLKMLEEKNGAGNHLWFELINEYNL